MTTFKREDYAWHIKKCNIMKAWVLWGHGSSDFGVAIVDSGVDIREGMARDHLEDRVAGAHTCIDSARGSGEIRSLHWRNYFDSNGHGTMMAGLVAADHCPLWRGVAGCIGIAKKVRLLNLRVADNFGDVCEKDLIAVAKVLAKSPPKGLKRVGIAVFGFDDRVWQRICKKSVEEVFRILGKAGILGVVAAGDRNRDVSCLSTHPANLRARDNVLVVAGRSQSGKLRASSNYGRAVDLAAPASNLLTIGPRSAAVMNGSSGAAAIVAGVAALLWSRGVAKEPHTVKSKLLKACTVEEPKLGKKISGRRTLKIR